MKYLKVIILLNSLILLTFVLSLLFYKNNEPKPLETPIVVKSEQSVPKECSVDEMLIIEAVNNNRISAGVAPLTFNTLLDKFANERSSEQLGMIDEHKGFQPKLNNFTNMGYKLIGEDLLLASCNVYNEEQLVDLFRNSQPHWTSLMNKRYNDIGVGFYKNVLTINLGDK